MMNGTGVVGGRSAQQGFTLLELMIAVVIVGILAAIAYPSYIDIVVRNNRAAAQSALTELISRQESYFTQNKQYADNIRDLGYPSSPTGLRNNGGLADLDQGSTSGLVYKLQVSSAVPFDSDTNFRVEAVPTNVQMRDNDCGTLFITAAGTRGATGGGNDCW